MFLHLFISVGVPICTSETTVVVKIVSVDQPVFEQQFYETWIPEDAGNITMNMNMNEGMNMNKI
jgi:hypothetical protein